MNHTKETGGKERKKVKAKGNSKPYTEKNKPDRSGREGKGGETFSTGSATRRKI